MDNLQNRSATGPIVMSRRVLISHSRLSLLFQPVRIYGMRKSALSTQHFCWGAANRGLNTWFSRDVHNCLTGGISSWCKAASRARGVKNKHGSGSGPYVHLVCPKVTFLNAKRANVVTWTVMFRLWCTFIVFRCDDGWGLSTRSIYFPAALAVVAPAVAVNSISLAAALVLQAYFTQFKIASLLRQNLT